MEKTVFSTNGAGSTGRQHAEICELTHSYLFVLRSTQIGSRPPHETRHTETNRKETGEDPGGHGHRGKVSEQTTNSLCSKIKN